jgi:DNA helicase HerA-like ATPase
MPRPPLSVPVARGDDDLALLAGMANRHGLVAGATGTGKTVTLRVMAVGSSRLGVPVFVADDVLESMAKSAARAAGTQLGREIMRGVFGSLFGGRRR